jgi:hypothetical protein
LRATTAERATLGEIGHRLGRKVLGEVANVARPAKLNTPIGGLYAEDTGHRGDALGKFPQAFTHLALVRAAFNLDRALGPGRS